LTGSGSKPKVVAGAEINSPGRASSDAATAFMVGTSILHDSHLEARLTGAQAKVDILERKEIRLVEEADPFEHFALNQHHATADSVNGAQAIGANRRNTTSGPTMPHATRAR